MQDIYMKHMVKLDCSEQEAAVLAEIMTGTRDDDLEHQKSCWPLKERTLGQRQPSLCDKKQIWKLD